MVVNMDYKEEISYREELLKKVHKGNKLTPDERVWAVTHPVYNRTMGYPILNVAIEKLGSEKWFLLKINIESINYDRMIGPIIYVPAGKGSIITSFEVENLSGQKSIGKPIKMLSLLSNKQNKTAEVKYQSKLGILSVSYECDYFDKSVNLLLRQSSDTGHPYFAMQREVISNNKVKYYCKDPCTDTFDALIFSIEWILINN